MLGAPAAVMPAGQYTVVAGVRWGNTTGYQTIVGHASGTSLGSNGASQWAYALYCTPEKYYWDGNEYSAAQAIDTAAHVTGYRVTTLGDWVTTGSFPVQIGTDGWGDHFSGVIAFVYIYRGAPPASLLARLAANPYRMFE